MSKTPPHHLSDKARKLFSSLQAEYAIFDPDGILLLTTAMECYDRIDEARAIIQRDGLTDLDRFGQTRPHPAVKIERDARGQLLSSLRALNLGVHAVEM